MYLIKLRQIVRQSSIELNFKELIALSSLQIKVLIIGTIAESKIREKALFHYAPTLGDIIQKNPLGEKAIKEKKMQMKIFLENLILVN